jgi:Bacterial Ig domain
MTTDRVRGPEASGGVARRGRRVGPPGALFAVLAMFAAFTPSGGPLARAVKTVDAAGQAVPSISIGDASIVEGNSGVTTLSFPVTLDSPSQQEVRVSYGTVGGVAGGTATGGLVTTLRQSAGVLTSIPDVGPASTYPITIPVSGVTGPLEQIDVLISGLTHGSAADVDMLLEAPGGQKMIVLSDAGGPGSVAKVVLNLRDDAPAPISPTALQSGAFLTFSGSPPEAFPVPTPPGPYAEAGPAGPDTLNDTFRGIDPNGTWKFWIFDDTPGNQGSVGSISLTLGVADMTGDFVARFGQLVFPPGTTTRQVVVKINGDTTVEPNETILVDLFTPINGVIGDDQAVGTIVNDDGGSGGFPPTTANDAYQAFRDTPLQVASPGVLANDMTNLGGSMSARVVTPPSFGQLTLATDGSFKYIPGPNFVGTDTFTYRAVNAAGDGNVATVTITVNPPTPPTAVNDEYEVFGRDGARLAAQGVLSNDLANGGGPLTVVLVDGPRQGTLRLNPDGGFVYQANSQMFGGDSFTYRAVNASGQSSNVAVVTLVDARTERLRVTSVDRNRVTIVRFDPPSSAAPPDQYALAGGVLPGQTLASVPTGSQFPIFTFTAPPGSFLIRVHPLFGSDQGGPSNEVPLHVNTTVPPSAPENLLITVNGSNLDLAWKNTFSGGIPTNVILDVTGSANVSIPLGPTESFSFAGAPSGTYNFTVRGVNAGGSSVSSNSVTGTFPGPCSGPPLTPENFLLYVDRLVLGAIWDLPSSGPAPTGYVLNVTSPVFNGPVTVRTTNVRAIVGSGVYSVTVTPFDSCGSGMPTPLQTVIVQ